MGFLIWLCLTLSALEAGFCAYLWFELQKRLSETRALPILRQLSDELNKDYGRQFRSIETEWSDMYQKFSRLVGRVDREKRPSVPVEPPDNPPPLPLTRSELVRRWRANK